MKYTDQQRLYIIYENAIKLYNYIQEKEITREDILKEFSVQWTITTPLCNIGEYAYNLSNRYKKEHNEIRWSVIEGMRRRSENDYDAINWDLIADIVFEEIPNLIEQIVVNQFLH